MRFYILRASLTNQINAGYSPRPSLFVVGTFIACSYTSMVAFAKYLEILLMASFELHIAAFKYGGWGLCILIHIVIALKLFVMRSMFVFISELLQEFVIPKGLDFHYQTNTVYTQEGGEYIQRSIFHSSYSAQPLSQFFPATDSNTVQKAIGYLCPASRETESGIYHTLQKVRQRADAASKAAGCPAASTLTLPTHILERKTKQNKKHRKHQK